MAFDPLKIFSLQGVVDFALGPARKQMADFVKEGQNAADEGNTAWNRWSTTLTTFAGPAVLGAVGVALSTITADVVRFAVEIDKAMTAFQVQTGAAIDEVNRFSETVKNLKQVNTDSTEAIGAAIIQVRRDFGDLGDEMDTVTQSMLDYAKVTEQRAGKATSDVANIMRAWGLEASQAQQLTDVLTKTFQETGVKVESLQMNLNRSAPALQALGLGVERSAALMGIMAKQGVSAEVAMSGLMSIVQKSADPTEKQAKAFERLGIAIDESGRPMGGAGAALDGLIERFGSDKPFDMADAIEILGKRASNDLVRGLAAGGGAIDELQGKLEEASGTVKTASDIIDKQLGERVKLLKGKYWDPAMNDMGQFLLHLQKLFLENIGPLFDWFRDLAKFAGQASVEMQVSWNGAVTAMKDIFENFTDVVMQKWADMLDFILSGIQALPGQVRGPLQDVEQSLIKSISKIRRRDKPKVGLSEAFESLKGAATAFFSPGQSVEKIATDTQDVLVSEKERAAKKPLGAGGTTPPPAQTADPADAFEKRVKALERLVDLEKISKQTGVARFQALLREAKNLGIAEEDIFKIEKRILALKKQIAAEDKKAAAERDKDAKKRQRAADKLAKERDKAAKKAAAEAKKAAAEAEKAAKQKMRFEKEILDAKLRSEGKLRQIEVNAVKEKVAAFRAAGVEEAKIAEFVAAQKKRILGEEKKAVDDLLKARDSLLGKRGFTTGGVQTLEEAFAPKEDTGPVFGTAKKDDKKSGDLTDAEVKAQLGDLGGSVTSDLRRLTQQQGRGPLTESQLAARLGVFGKNLTRGFSRAGVPQSTLAKLDSTSVGGRGDRVLKQTPEAAEALASRLEIFVEIKDPTPNTTKRRVTTEGRGGRAGEALASINHEYNPAGF